MLGQRSFLGRCLRLWLLGVWESLQLHRCVVLLALDNSQELWAGVWHCLVLNGLLLLGTITWRLLALQPATRWLLMRWVEPCYGPVWTRFFVLSLDAAFEVLLVLPMYLVTVLASSLQYSKVAKAAYAVQQQRRAATLGAKAVPHSPKEWQGGVPPSISPGLGHVPAKGVRAADGSSSTAGFESVAQEVYRVMLLSVLFAEVWLLGQVPRIGKALYFIFMTWLWSYYCYDYKWSLQAIRLADRLAFFESRWAFFSGYGALMSATTMLLPSYWGAACSSVLFLLFIIVACDTEPDDVVKRWSRNDNGHGTPQGGVVLGRFPVFWLPLWTCRQFFRGFS